MTVPQAAVGEGKSSPQIDNFPPHLAAGEDARSGVILLLAKWRRCQRIRFDQEVEPPPVTHTVKGPAGMELPAVPYNNGHRNRKRMNLCMQNSTAVHGCSLGSAVLHTIHWHLL